MARRASDGDAGDIEFLAPDPTAFAGTTMAAGLPPDPGPEPSADEPLPAPRRAGIVATVGLLALVAAGTAVVAPWGGDAATPPTSPPPTTLPAALPGTGPATEATDGVTTAAPTSTIDPFTLATPGFVITPPSDLRLTGAYSTEADDPGAGRSPTAGWGDVWATPDATRTSGRWVSVTVLPYGWDVISTNAVRIDAGGRVGVLTTADDGGKTLEIVYGTQVDRFTLRLEAWGFSLDELTALAASIDVDTDPTAPDDDQAVVAATRPTYRSPELLDGLTMLMSEGTETDPIISTVGRAITAATIYTNPDVTREVWLVRLDPTSFDRSIFALWFTPRALSTDQVLSRATALPDDLVMGTIDSGVVFGSLALWTDPGSGELLLAFGTLEPAEIQALVPSVRQASPAEWSAARRSQPDGGSDSSTLPPDPTLVAGQGTLADGTAWKVTVDPVDPVGRLRLGGDESSWPMFDDAADRIALLARPDLAIAVVRMPGANTVRITTADGVIEQAFVDAAAIVVDALGPYTVDILDATGQMVDTE